MGFFRKKADPLAQRAQTLNRRIAELEAEIARLNQTVTPGPARPTAGTRNPAPSGPAGSSANPANPANPSHRPPSAPGHHEPVFEPMPPRPLEPRAPEGPGREAVQLGLKRSAWSQAWSRLKRHFVDPPPTNEKLVNYLAAGGIQGLRPLRYERRIARNRIVFICIVLGLLLWGLLVIFWHTR